MMYASKIKIDYNPIRIRYHRQVELPDRLLDLKDISKHLKEGEKFGFQEKEIGGFGTAIFMDIIGFRDETQKELKERILKGEEYNKRYEEFHKKYVK